MEEAAFVVLVIIALGVLLVVIRRLPQNLPRPPLPARPPIDDRARPHADGSGARPPRRLPRRTSDARDRRTEGGGVMQFVLWFLVTIALLGVAFAVGFALEWLSGARERRGARRRNAAGGGGSGVGGDDPRGHEPGRARAPRRHRGPPPRQRGAGRGRRGRHRAGRLRQPRGGVPDRAAPRGPPLAADHRRGGASVRAGPCGGVRGALVTVALASVGLWRNEAHDYWGAGED